MKNRKSLFCMFLFTAICATTQSQSAEYSIKVLCGEELQTLRTFFSEHRLTAFREYPYLYLGSQEEAYIYFDWFSRLPNSAIAVAYVDQAPVGFLAGTDFSDFDDHFEGSIDLFESAGLDASLYYYFSESIIAPEHRKSRVFTQLAHALEHHAAMLGYQKVCFVHEEHETHALKPDDYKDLSPLFLHFGCQPTSLMIKFSWKTIQPNGNVEEQEHEMRYWVKNL